MSDSGIAKGEAFAAVAPWEDWTAKNIIVESVVHTAELDVFFNHL